VERFWRTIDIDAKLVEAGFQPRRTVAGGQS
jgi:hypothetical protein